MHFLLKKVRKGSLPYLTLIDIDISLPTFFQGD